LLLCAGRYVWSRSEKIRISCRPGSTNTLPSFHSDNSPDIRLSRTPTSPRATVAKGGFL
jgi:hypothetical protein